VTHPAHSLLFVSAAALVAAVVLTPLVIRIVIARGILEPAEGARVSHRAAVPRVGGVAIVAAFALAVLVLPSPEAWGIAPGPGGLVPLVLAAIAMVVTGLLEDLRGLSLRAAVAVQILVAAGLFAAGYRVGVVAVPFGGEVELGALALPFAIVWLVAMTNVFDIARGLDGLAGALALVATLGLLVAAFHQEDWEAGFVLAAVAGALLGFLRFNFDPARVFLGRCGTRPIGLVLGAVALGARLKSPATLAAVVPLVAIVLPLLDVVLPSGDRPRLPERPVLVVYGLAVLVAMVTLVTTEGPALALGAAAAVLLLALGLSMRGLGRSSSEAQRSVVARLAEGLRPSGDATLRALEADLAPARDLDAAWPRLCQGAWLLGLLEAHLTPRPGWEDRLPELHSFAPDFTHAWRSGLVRETTWSFELSARGEVVAELVARAPAWLTEFDPVRFVTVVDRLVTRHLEALELAAPVSDPAIERPAPGAPGGD
jgi:UDP-N-acetylmuramyl pentapeptide phosphotransferase/UDP-N-acetylglucosamine-1-phosphate transferase